MGLTSQISGMRVRLRLTALYGLLFLLSGAVLLTITYFLVTHSGPNIVMSMHSTSRFGGQSVSTYLAETLPANVQLPDAERRITQAFQEQAVQQQAQIMHQLLVRSGMALAMMSVIAVVLGWLVAGRVEVATGTAD